MSGTSESPRSTRSSAAITLMANAVSGGGALLFGVAAARWFGSAGRGEVAAFMYWPLLATALAAAGIPHSAVYYSAHDTEQSDEIIGTGMVVALMTGIAGASFVAVLLPVLIGDGKDHIVDASRIFLIGVPVTAVVNVAYHPLRVLHRIGQWNAIRVLVDLTPMIALSVVAVLSSRELITYAVALLSVRVLVGVLAIGTVVRAVGIRVSGLWFRPLLAYGLPTVFATLPALLNFRVDQAFLLRMVDAAELGNYAVAVAWGQAIVILANVIQYMVLPRVADLTGATRLAEHEHILRVTTMLMVGIAVPYTLVSPVVVPILFGDQFELAGRLSAVMVPAAALLGISTVSQEVLRAEKRLRGPLVSQIVGLVVTFGAILLLVPTIGAWGAAVASFGAYAIVILMLSWHLRRMGLPTASPFLLPGPREFRLVRSTIAMGVDRVRGALGRRS